MAFGHGNGVVAVQDGCAFRGGAPTRLCDAHRQICLWGGSGEEDVEGTALPVEAGARALA